MAKATTEKRKKLPKTIGMRKKLTDAEYWKEVAEIMEQFKKLELMIKDRKSVV